MRTLLQFAVVIFPPTLLTCLNVARGLHLFCCCFSEFVERHQPNDCGNSWTGRDFTTYIKSFKFHRASWNLLSLPDHLKTKKRATVSMTGFSFLFLYTFRWSAFWFVSSMRFHFFFPSGDSLGCTTAVTGTHENNHSSRNRMQRTYQTLCDSVLLFNMNHKCLRWDWKRLRDEAKFFSFTINLSLSVMTLVLLPFNIKNDLPMAEALNPFHPLCVLSFHPAEKKKVDN